MAIHSGQPVMATLRPRGNPDLAPGIAAQHRSLSALPTSSLAPRAADNEKPRRSLGADGA